MIKTIIALLCIACGIEDCYGMQRAQTAFSAALVASPTITDQTPQISSASMGAAVENSLERKQAEELQEELRKSHQRKSAERKAALETMILRILKEKHPKKSAEYFTLENFKKLSAAQQQKITHEAHKRLVGSATRKNLVSKPSHRRQKTKVEDVTGFDSADFAKTLPKLSDTAHSCWRKLFSCCSCS